MFALLETMRAQDGMVVRRNAHVARLRESAAYFGFALDESGVVRALDDAAQVATSPCTAAAARDAGWQLRLDPPVELDVDVDVAAPVAPVRAASAASTRHVALSRTPVDSRDPSSVTRRRIAISTTRDSPTHASIERELFDVLLWNERPLTR